MTRPATINGRNVTFEPHSLIALLVEVTRASLHGGAPSCVIRKVVEGMHQYAYEREHAGNALPEDERRLLGACMTELAALHDAWRKREDETYT